MDKPTELRTSSRSNGRSGGGSTAFAFGIWGWLFTIAFLHLSFWQGVLAIVIWPLYLGWYFSSMHGGG